MNERKRRKRRSGGAEHGGAKTSKDDDRPSTAVRQCNSLPAVCCTMLARVLHDVEEEIAFEVQPTAEAVCTARQTGRTSRPAGQTRLVIVARVYSYSTQVRSFVRGLSGVARLRVLGVWNPGDSLSPLKFAPARGPSWSTFQLTLVLPVRPSK